MEQSLQIWNCSSLGFLKYYNPTEWNRRQQWVPTIRTGCSEQVLVRPISVQSFLVLLEYSHCDWAIQDVQGRTQTIDKITTLTSELTRKIDRDWIRISLEPSTPFNGSFWFRPLLKWEECDPHRWPSASGELFGIQVLKS